jgi:thiamine-monophosphate kinase
MGEFELLERVRERLGVPSGRVLIGSGDDAAVTVPGGATATSVDALVEGVHFRRDTADGLAWIGRKALATALSDLAAMGASPGEAYVAVGVAPDLDEEECLELVDGIAELAAEAGITVAGGDLTSSPTLFITVTVVGHATEPSALVSRSGARPGDLLVVTGELGAAAAGLLVSSKRGIVDPSRFEPLLDRQLRPQARLIAGSALAAAGATAMIDLSDGLGGDARHLAKASGVGLRIAAEKLPIAAGVEEVATAAGADPLELAVSGGEDYELLAALPAAVGADLGTLPASAGVAITVIGEVIAGAGVEIRLPGGRMLNPAGYEQMRQPRSAR